MPSLAKFSLTRYSYYSRSAHQTTTTIISTCHTILYSSFRSLVLIPNQHWDWEGGGGSYKGANRRQRWQRNRLFLYLGWSPLQRISVRSNGHLYNATPSTRLPPQNLLIIMKSPEWPAYLCTIEVPSRSQIIVQFEKSGMLISYFYNIVIIVSSNWLGRCYCWMVPSTTTSTMRSLKSS